MTSLGDTGITPMRARMIQRSIKASQVLFNALLSAPSSALHLLGLPSWSNWFYSTLLVIKIVIFQRTGSNGSSCVHNTPHAIDDVIPSEFGESATAAVCNITTSFSQASLRDKPVTAEEAWLGQMFEAFLEKLEGAMPEIEEGLEKDAPKAFLRQVAKLQRGFLAGLRKVTEVGRERVGDGGQQRDTEARGEQQEGDASLSETYPVQGLYHVDPTNDAQAVFIDDPGFADYSGLQQDPMDDLIWNMVMDDGSNMFAW